MKETVTDPKNMRDSVKDINVYAHFTLLQSY